MKRRNFAVACAVALAMCAAAAQETAPESSTNIVVAALVKNTGGGIATNDTAEAKLGRDGVPPPSAWIDAIKFAEDVRQAISNLLVETAMIRNEMIGLGNRLDELIECENARKSESPQIKEVKVVTNTVAAIEPKFVEDAVKPVGARLERVEAAVAGVAKSLDDAANKPKEEDVAPQMKDRLPNSTVVLLVIVFIAIMAVLALVITIKTAVVRQIGELCEGRALLLDKLPGAVGENLKGRFDDMARGRGRADDQFNNLANAIGDLKEMLRSGLRSCEVTEERHVPLSAESNSGISSREEERLRMRVRELETCLRAKDGEISGMKAREEAAAQKIQDEVKAAQENEARMKKALDEVSGQLAEAKARLERQAVSGISFLGAEAFKKAKVDMEEWRVAYPDEVSVLESAISLIRRRKVLSKGTWSSALRDIAATVSSVLERRGSSPEAVRETLDDWSKALDRLAQSSPGGTFALPVPQLGDQVDSSWMTTVGGALPSRVGAVRTWAVYIDGKIQCYAEVK